MSYRGIALAPASYKLFCGILNNRLIKWAETNEILADEQKAYYSINTPLIWTKHEDLGIGGNILTVIKSIYNDVQFCVRLNGIDTNWFRVTNGFKQGCMLSPLVFNMFINNLVETIEGLGIGVDTGQEKVSILMYADDLVLLAETKTIFR